MRYLRIKHMDIMVGSGLEIVKAWILKGSNELNSSGCEPASA